MNKFSFSNLFSDFHSSNIGKEELERIITDAIKKEHPESEIKNIAYNKDGMKVKLLDGTTIDIEIDWQEIVLS